MKEEKGILGRLLTIAGAILIATGVFVFQGLSSADETDTAGGAGDVGLAINEEPGEDTEGESGEGEEAGEGEETGEASDETTSGAEENVIEYKIEYYLASELEKEEPVAFEKQSHLGTEAEYTFNVIKNAPEAEGDFLGWYKKDEEKIGEYYKADDEIKLTEAEPILKLVAKFAVLENYAMRYNANGGIGAPGAQVCQDYFGKCDFEL